MKNERQRAEASLRKYERVVAATTDAICLLDRTYTHQLVNQAYLQWYQQPREALIGHTMNELLGTETFNELIKDKLDQCLAGENIQNQLWIEYQLLDNSLLAAPTAHTMKPIKPFQAW